MMNPITRVTIQADRSNKLAIGFQRMDNPPHRWYTEFSYESAERLKAFCNNNTDPYVDYTANWVEITWKIERE